MKIKGKVKNPICILLLIGLSLLSACGGSTKQTTKTNTDSIPVKKILHNSIYTLEEISSMYEYREIINTDDKLKKTEATTLLLINYNINSEIDSNLYAIAIQVKDSMYIVKKLFSIPAEAFNWSKYCSKNNNWEECIATQVNTYTDTIEISCKTTDEIVNKTFLTYSDGQLQFLYNYSVLDTIEETVLYEIQNFAKVKLEKNSHKAYIYYDEYNQAIDLVFKRYDKKYISTSSIQGINLLYSNRACSMSNDTIKIFDNYDEYEHTIFLLYKDRKMKQISDTTININDWISASMDKAWKNGDPIRYYELTSSIQYGNGNNMLYAKIAMQLADSISNKYIKRNDYVSAAKLMDSLIHSYLFYTDTELINTMGSIFERSIEYCYKAQMYEKGIRICKNILENDSTQKHYYLYWADGLYLQNNKREAQKFYQIYKQQQKDKSIPKRVDERLKEK